LGWISEDTEAIITIKKMEDIYFSVKDKVRKMTPDDKLDQPGKYDIIGTNGEPKDTPDSNAKDKGTVYNNGPGANTISIRY
jgi:hypothetical protein